MKQIIFILCFLFFSIKCLSSANNTPFHDPMVNMEPVKKKAWEAKGSARGSYYSMLFNDISLPGERPWDLRGHLSTI